MAVDMRKIGMHIINRHKNRMRGAKKSTSTAEFVRRNIQRMNKIKADVKKAHKIKKKHAKAPKKVTIRNPLVPKILQPIANITPIGWLKGTTHHKRKLTTNDVIAGIGKIGKVGGSHMAIRYGGPELRFDSIEEPTPEEIQIQPHPIFEDTVTTGEDLDEDAWKESYKKTIGDINIPFVPVVKPPDWALPDFKLPDFGSLGKYALLAIAGIAAIMLLGRRK